MSPTGEHSLDWVKERIRAVYAGRRFLCAEGVLVAAAGDVTRLRTVGADGFALGVIQGTGEIAADIETLCLDGPKAGSMMEGIRQGMQALERLPPDVLARIDAWDPERSARVILPIFGEVQELAGRRVWGPRPTAWVALEDKTVVDGVWDGLGVPRARSAVVALQWDALEAAHRDLDQGMGTVWAADNKLGWHGGAEYTRWVHDLDDARAVQAEFQDAADEVRVMPFLEGIPSSIHGIVFDDHVLALRPCEMMVLRDPGSRRFHYAQAATYWDPPEADRQAMRALAQRTGAHLRDTVDYRGAFTIDGVMTGDGFRPTELNTRFGAALAIMSRVFQDAPLTLLSMALIERAPVDFEPGRLEEELLALADGNRSAGGMCMVPRELPPGTRWFRREAGAWVETDEASHEVKVLVGPAVIGSALFFRWSPKALVVGEPVAPVLSSLLSALDAAWGLGLGRLEAAPDARTATR